MSAAISGLANTLVDLVTPSKSVLIVLTSCSKFSKIDRPTGWYLPELAHPYYEFLEAGFSITMASPEGGPAPLDPDSVSAFSSDAVCQRFQADEEAQHKVATTTPLFEVSHVAYNGIFYVGGHGPCEDLVTDVNSLEVLSKFVSAEKPIGAVCHAPIVLTHLMDASGEAPYCRGRRMTGFTDSEEEAAGLTHAVPFLLESKFREQGADFVKASQDWGECVVRDGKLVTGQNPASASKTARVLIEAMNE